MLKTTIILSVLALSFCERQKENVSPVVDNLKSLTITVESGDGRTKYSEKDVYPITVENPSGSFKTVSTGLYFSGRVPVGSLRASIQNSSWFYGTNEDFEIKNDTTIVLKINEGYRWRKGI